MDVPPNTRPLRILLVSPADRGGGAERVALDLLRSYRAAGHDAWLAVGQQTTQQPHVVEIPNESSRSAWAHTVSGFLPGVRGGRPLRLLRESVGQPGRVLARLGGQEDMEFPGVWRLLETVPSPVDVVHLHNLHAGYFDLRALPWLSNRLPCIWTIHDMWPLTGHCAYAMECGRWAQGCGACPDLERYPSIRRDGTAFNLKRKGSIYARSRLHLAAPSAWMMNQVDGSMLGSCAVEKRLVPNGVDTQLFRPREEARAQLGIAGDARVLVSSGYGLTRNPYKDFETLHAALKLLGSTVNTGVDAWALGAPGLDQQLGRVRLRGLPFTADREAVARVMAAGDVFVHATRAESAGLVILEALACGRPVVASAVGGVPEQLPAQHWSAGATPGPTDCGWLVPVGDAAALSASLAWMLDRPAICRQMGKRGRDHVERHRAWDTQVTAYLDWMARLVAERQT